MMPQAVILSLTRALDCMALGNLTEDDLKDAIFCLGCTRPFALELDAEKILKRQLPHQTEPIELGYVMKFTKYLEEAERNNRVLWRRFDSGEDKPAPIVLNDLSAMLKKHGLNPLNSNLPFILENSFLKTAIERTNNKNGVDRVLVFW